MYALEQIVLCALYLVLGSQVITLVAKTRTKY